MSKVYLLTVLAAFVAVGFTSNIESVQDKNAGITSPFIPKKTTPISLQQLPDDFPKIEVNILESPTEGTIFMECFQVSTPDENYIMLMNEKGEVIWYKKPENQGVDFKMASNGRYSFSSRVELGDKYQAGPLTVQNIKVQHYIMDQEYNIIDSVQMQNEYLADMHDFRILNNGNYLLMSYEGIPIDMSKIVPGGNPNAKVVATVYQELDKDKNCVFQWRSVDHIPLLATKDNPLKAIFEHVHGNSFFMDKDGNLITSFPTTFEIVKIDMISGDLIWRFGGDANQFEITGDNEIDHPYYFTMQHDAKLLPNGNLLFYDNAFQKKSGWNSRAVEYEFDQENLKAHMVWEYKNEPPISAYAMGSAQRLDNGNTLINWGLMFTGHRRAMTEINPNKEKLFELTMPPLNFSYRAHKHLLPPCRPISEVEKYEMYQGNTYDFDDEGGDTGIEIYFKELEGFIYNYLKVQRFDCAPLDPKFEGEAPVVLQCRYILEPQMIYSMNVEVRFDLTKFPPYSDENELIVYYRDTANSGVFKKLETFMNNSNQLVAITENFGEFIIAFERKNQILKKPITIYPVNGKKIINDESVKLVWTPTGRFDNFRLQVAEDSLFASVIFDSTGCKATLLNLKFGSDSEYFWRVKTNYRDIESEWSNSSKFYLTSPFISITYPNGGENLFTDSTYIIRWETNLSDSVKINLLKNDEKVAVISDGIFSYSNAIQWKVPKNLTVGDNYSIEVASYNNENLYARSDDYFNILDAVSVKESDYINFNSIKVNLSPNPSTGIVRIELSSPDTKQINLKVVDVLGNEIYKLNNTNSNLMFKDFEIDLGKLAKGVYYIIFYNGMTSTIEKIIISD